MSELMKDCAMAEICGGLEKIEVLGLFSLLVFIIIIVIIIQSKSLNNGKSVVVHLG